VAEKRKSEEVFRAALESSQARIVRQDHVAVHIGFQQFLRTIWASSMLTLSSIGDFVFWSQRQT
jgi:hypothetical protein